MINSSSLPLSPSLGGEGEDQCLLFFLGTRGSAGTGGGLGNGTINKQKQQQTQQKDQKMKMSISSTVELAKGSLVLM